MHFPSSRKHHFSTSPTAFLLVSFRLGHRPFLSQPSPPKVRHFISLRPALHVFSAIASTDAVNVHGFGKLHLVVLLGIAAARYQFALPLSEDVLVLVYLFFNGGVQPSRRCIRPFD